jgi:hypothetical protein
MTRYWVCLSYYEKESSKLNLQFFLEHGIVPGADYVVVVNGFRCTVPIPPGIKVLRRDNTGGDFGAWGNALALTDLSMYTHFVLLNDTVRGPFLPRYIPASLSWLDLFTSKLDETTKLVGLTMNYFPWINHWFREEGKPERQILSLQQYMACVPQYCEESKHVQSMCVCTDSVGIRIMLDHHIFDVSPTGGKNVSVSNDVRKRFIIKHEIGMSQVILKSGYDITALQLTESKSIPTGDIHGYYQRYFGTTIHPLEIMFIKSERFMTTPSSQTTMDLYTFVTE